MSMDRRERIRDRLQALLSPTHLDVVNESDQHAGPPGRETHFRIEAVSAAFEGLDQVRRHRMIYQALSEEMAQGLHAVGLHTYAPAEWQGEARASPTCEGGESAAESGERTA